MRWCAAYCSSTPQIDAIELITPEGGGEGRTVTGDEALALSRELFGETVTREALRALTESGGLPFGGCPTYALEGTLRSIKQIWRVWSRREQLLKDFPGKDMQVGLYVTCRETLRAAKEVMDRIFPADLVYTFLPSHGAKAVADTIEYMNLSNEDLQRTMLYSWVEFDGNMYLQQNSCGGIQRLMDVCRAAAPDSIYGACFNHWRTAENSVTISYAAETTRSYVPADRCYLQYAEDHGIGSPEGFREQMRRLDELDIYNRDNLFNVGFCFLGCWLNPKGLGWIRSWKPEALEHSMAAYQSLIIGLSQCLKKTSLPEGIGRLRLLLNRCACSIEHLKAIRELNKIAGMTDDSHPEALSDQQRQEVQELARRAMEFSRSYQRLHIREMPDRGCEGTIASYCETIPVYIDHVLQYFAVGETVCTHRPPSLDDPPAPDTEFV